MSRIIPSCIPARPDLAVIDKAVRRIEKRLDAQTCWALFHASDDIGGYPNNNVYVRQFRAFVTDQDSHFPIWWNNCYTAANKKHRIAALKAFRQACIDAAIQAPGAEHPINPEDHP